MTTTTTTKTIVNIDLSDWEIRCLKVATQVIANLDSVYPFDIDLVSEETGEVISTNELRRVMGILDGLTCGYNKNWAVN